MQLSIAELRREVMFIGTSRAILWSANCFANNDDLIVRYQVKFEIAIEGGRSQVYYLGTQKRAICKKAQK